MTPQFVTTGYCVITGMLEQESAYSRALSRVEFYHLDGNMLTLTSADGSVQLTFGAN